MGHVSLGTRALRCRVLAVLLLSAAVESNPQYQRRFRSDAGAYGAASYNSLGIQPANNALGQSIGTNLT